MLKAYCYTDDQTGYSTIYYAENRNKAKLIAAGDQDENYIDVNIHRAPWADEYGSMDNIPFEKFLEQGWRYECIKCSQWLDQTDIDENNAFIVKGGLICKKCQGRLRNEQVRPR